MNIAMILEMAASAAPRHPVVTGEGRSLTALGLQDLADILPDELALLLDGRAELALGIEADLARDIDDARAGGHLAAQAVLARKRDGRRIMELVGHRGLPIY